jgi:predicted CopG family antitoxin
MLSARTVNLSQDAYDLLASLKHDRESFSDVVKRLAGERSLIEIVGVLDQDQAARFAERVEQGRERSRRRRARQLK